jgi:regulatory protein
MLSDSSVRLTSASVLKELDIVAGDNVVVAELEDCIAQLERDHARERALRLVGYRERSASQLRGRLVDDGYPSGLAAAVVERFIELGLIDDERFARMYVRSRRRSGFGPQRVARELRDKGVSEEVARLAMGESDAFDPVESARRVLGGRVPVDRRERERFVRRLVAKGFDMRTALEAVESPDTTAKG